MLVQQARYLRNIADVAAPESALAMYYYGYLLKEVFGTVDPMVINRLRARLEASPYWQARFIDFNLSIDDLTGTPGSGIKSSSDISLNDLGEGWLPDDLYGDELASAQPVQQAARN